MQPNRLPVTVIYGLPGSGKTTLAGHLRDHRPGEHIALSAAYGGETGFGHIHQLALSHDLDYLLIEAGGSCQPETLAVTLTENNGAGSGLLELVHLDTMVAVVDVSSVLEDFCSWDLLSDRGLVAHLGQDRALVEALTEQIEFADVVVLNKTDRAPARVKHSAGVLVRTLNPEAEIIETEFGRISPERLLSTRAFELERARNRARWVRVLSGADSNTRDALGISSFLYYSRRPFHPERLMHFIRSEWPGVVRCRGFFWLATRMDWIGEISQAGTARRHRAVGSWWAAILAGREHDGPFLERLAGFPWDARFGDRCQQLAFVGIDMDEADVRTRLNACLLDDAEFHRGPEVWQTYADPFPLWPVENSLRRSKH